MPVAHKRVNAELPVMDNFRVAELYETVRVSAPDLEDAVSSAVLMSAVSSVMSYEPGVIEVMK